VAIVIIASDFIRLENIIESIALKKMNIPSGKNLLRIWVEKIKYLGLKALEEYGKKFKGDRDPIPIYIMTSENENDKVYDSMENSNFFGYSTSYVFPQVKLLFD
jgi:UDP-N-acetylglucosamine pyrophosphorylase